jgi:hypothetical protein
VDAARLRRFLGNPVWDDDQTLEAQDVIESVEEGLGNRLNTKITPVPASETAPILASGLVMTTFHVASVTALNGVDIVGGALPDGWTLDDHWLRTANPATGAFLTYSAFRLSDWMSSRVDSVGTVAVEYMAGLGSVPPVRLAILKKAGVIMINRHDDTVVVRDLNAGEPRSLPPEDWTASELADLSRFRIHSAWK